MHKQRGELRLGAVLIASMVLAAAAIAALFSMRTERNLFAEGAAKVGKMATDSVAAAGSSGQMRKCVIHGKTVVSNTECSDQNKTTRVIKIQDSRGFEAPKKPAAPPPDSGADRMLDKMIEKQQQ